MAKTTFSRKEFYDLVWAEPLSAISRKYNISYTCLREVCNEMAITIPPNGYWSKLKFGKSVTKENFWESTKAKQEISLWLRTDQDTEEYFSKDTTALNKNKAEISKKLKSNDTKKTSPQIVDPIINITKEYYNLKDHKNWDYKKGNTFAINVSKALLSRALRLMEQFVNTMNACGHSVIGKAGNSFAVIYGEELQLSIVEKSNRIKYQDGNWLNSRLHYNGKLCLKYFYMYPQREWTDSTILLEDKLLDIIAKLEVIAHNKKVEREEREKRWAEQRRKEELTKQLVAIKEKELSDFKSTLRLASRYQKALELRNYITAFEDNAIKNNSLTEELQKWIEWARKKADWYDPFIEAYDLALDGANRDTLTWQSK
ncbi:hypothetical protein Palpr_1952 [Paludibacter propionicigenes WB4]|uniref:Uncharacterized protein n=1 Tax=Paludibacter propionicigenes (strain DSM 17365 / JCM 13257 / WB4) TaxID=694427 RepID=E4T5U7_PALPW|nr:hypothetical protein [Paludibacter propionicigenes]ADQ80091.1 hypothetical protein Palpr_1952 [Paludibacter propionicigenes WB4]